ncbi:DMT family transporter [Carboxylicivirga sp. N1Y90]|uniref:DMT family transporter n=1 Tax=Carboxylicivirga fragile TaxID=3417571 RepID=UPI003D349EBC|nr:DMT family transporter [Marinilabiliaceae bacterium N1Y90]
MQNQTKGVLLAGTTAILWGVLAIALKVSLKHFDAYTVVWFRFFVASIILAGYFAIKQPELLKIYKKPPWMMLLAAVLLGGNYIGYMQGVNYAGPAVTQVVIQAGPVLLGLIGFLFFKESINALRALGFGIAAIGFILFYVYQLNAAIADKDELIKGVAWILFAACSWTGYAVVNKRLVTKWPPHQINLIVFGLPVLLFLPLVNFSQFAMPHEPWVWLLMVALGLNTVVAYGTLSASFKYAEANRISIVITMNPIITFLLLEVLLLMDTQWFPIKEVPFMAYVGAALVLVGAILAVGIKGKAK